MDGDEVLGEAPPLEDFFEYHFEEEGVDFQGDDVTTIRTEFDAALQKYVLFWGVEELTPADHHYLSVLRLEQMIAKAIERHESVSTDTSELLDGLEEDARDQIVERAGRYHIGNLLTLAYSIAYETVEDLLRELVTTLLRDDVPDATGDILVSQLGSFEAKLQILDAAGILEERLVAALIQIKDVRHELVHEVGKRQRLPMMDDLGELEEVMWAVNTLYTQVYGEPLYMFPSGE